MSTSQDHGLGLQHLPESKVINKVREELEDELPEGYQIEEVNGYVYPPEEREGSGLKDPVTGRDIIELRRREEDTTYFVTDPTGHEVAEIGFSTAEANDVEKVTNYRFRAGKEDINSPEPDQAYSRLKRFGNESLESIIQSVTPERPLDEEEIDKMVMLNYEGETKSLDEAETEQFQKAVNVLEETDRAHIDTDHTDSDVFYDQEEMRDGYVFMVTDDYQNLLNFMRNTELYVEDSTET